jgi:hypothetical protein
MQAIRKHYEHRERVHRQLRAHFDAEQVVDFARLALGISDSAGNYSAAEHGLGPLILSRSSERDIYDLAVAIENCLNTNHLPTIIYSQSIYALKISIGSEMAMMLKPETYWVGNVRTIWSHLLVKHGMNERRANEELSYYYDADRESEMDYKVWRDVYLGMERDILVLGGMASQAAANQGIVPGSLRFMWPDAVASHLFDRFGEK